MVAFCSIRGCVDPPRRAGFCGRHYMKLLRHGDPTLGRKNASPGLGMAFVRMALRRRKQRGCLLWPFGLSKARYYPRVFVDGKNIRANRYVCTVYRGPAPSHEHHAAHLCGERTCLNRDHIVWVLPIINNGEHKIMHGRTARGMRNAHAKLTDGNVRTIRKLKGTATGTPKKLARRFGVHPGTIWAIQQGRSRRYV